MFLLAQQINLPPTPTLVSNTGEPIQLPAAPPLTQLSS